MRLRRPSFFLATWGGVGLMPVAPGTWGTLAALPVHWLLVLLPGAVHLGIVGALIVFGTIAAQAVATSLGEEDPQIVVVDESASVLLGLWIALPAGWPGLIAVIVLFRLLDIFKPWPISAAERLRPAGLGIMADDVLAGIVAGGVVRLVYNLLA
jgi:phosphatidylglycerophosphatase A